MLCQDRPLRAETVEALLQAAGQAWAAPKPLLQQQPAATGADAPPADVKREIVDVMPRGLALLHLRSGSKVVDGQVGGHTVHTWMSE